MVLRRWAEVFIMLEILYKILIYIVVIVVFIVTFVTFVILQVVDNINFGKKSND